MEYFVFLISNLTSVCKVHILYKGTDPKSVPLVSYLVLLQQSMHFFISIVNIIFLSRNLHLSMLPWHNTKFFFVLFSIVTQHGESKMNLTGRIGGDSELSERGCQVSIPYICLIVIPAEKQWANFNKKVCSKNFYLQIYIMLNNLKVCPCHYVAHVEQFWNFFWS